jgi:hypothetical protein
MNTVVTLEAQRAKAKKKKREDAAAWLWEAWDVLMEDMWQSDHPLRDSMWVIGKLIEAYLNVSLDPVSEEVEEDERFGKLGVVLMWKLVNDWSPSAGRNVPLPASIPEKPTPDGDGLRLIARVLCLTGQPNDKGDTEDTSLSMCGPGWYAEELCRSLAATWDALATKQAS